MADQQVDDAAPTPEPAPAAPEEGPREIMGLPVDMFVKGGTTSMRHDRMVQQEEAEAERRRDEHDAMKRMAQVPVDQGGAMMFNNQLQPNPQGVPMETPKVELVYLTAGGEPEYNKGKPLKCLADILVGMDPAHPEELTLVLVCPSCETRMPQGQCQIQLRQTNRKWELDTRAAGTLILWEEEVGNRKVVRTYRSAGVVMESERFTCPRCPWSARIDKNRVRPVR